MTDPSEPSRLSLKQVIASVLAAGFGVQSNKNRERDFKSGSGTQFVVVGIIATLVFVVTIFLVVKFVISSAGI
ncbi:MAG: DUF2970 domain-containing protein [Gammaproteobacteria bacterium]